MSNDCNDDGRTAAVLEPYVALGLVEFDMSLWCVSRGSFEAGAWQSLLRRAQNTSEWMIPLAVDEFVAIREHSSTLAEVLGSYPGFDSLSLPVRLFGSSGFRGRPAGAVVSNYVLHAAGAQPRIRALGVQIVRSAECEQLERRSCARFKCATHHHRPHCSCAISPDKRRCTNDPASAGEASAGPGDSPLWVNRYLTKSESEWKKRQERGLATAADVELALSTSLAAARDLHIVESVRIRVQRLAALLGAAPGRGQPASSAAQNAVAFLRSTLLARDPKGPENPAPSRKAASGGAGGSAQGLDMVVDRSGHVRPASWREKVRRAGHEHLNAASKRQPSAADG